MILHFDRSFLWSLLINIHLSVVLFGRTSPVENRYTRGHFDGIQIGSYRPNFLSEIHEEVFNGFNRSGIAPELQPPSFRISHGVSMGFLVQLLGQFHWCLAGTRSNTLQIIWVSRIAVTCIFEELAGCEPLRLSRTTKLLRQ